MKNFAIIVLSIATVAFAGLYYHESNKSNQARTTAEGLEQKVGELELAVDDQQKTSDKLRAELKQIQSDSVARNRELVELRAASTNPAQRAIAPSSLPGQKAAKPSNPFSSMAKMFEDPEMREAIAAQQKAALGPILDKTYAKLFSDLRLTPDQAASLKEMLLNKQLTGAQMGMSMLSGGSDPAKTAELGQKVKAANEAADAEIKAFLGDDKFAQLKTYEKTTPDRMAISGFKDQLTGGAALTPEQEEQLIGVMTQERQSFKFTTDLTDKSKLTGDISATFNEENVNRYVQEMDQLNQHFISHAQNILSPDQLESFQKYLNNQQAMQKVGMKMGAKMFAPAKQPATE
jgi:hypothetical protein